MILLAQVDILDPVVQYVFAGFCAVLVVHLVWVNRRLVNQHDIAMAHIKEVIERLPCLTHAEQLRQQEKQINNILSSRAEGGQV